MWHCLHTARCTNFIALSNYIPVHLTPASSLWEQAWRPVGLVARHCKRLASDPIQFKCSKKMGPEPRPKKALRNATDPVFKKIFRYNNYWFFCWKLLTHGSTIEGFSQLGAHHLSIFRAESIVTDSTPGIVNADLHSTLQWVVPSNQPESPISAVASRSHTV